MKTKKFRTKTEFIPRDNSSIPGIWEIAIDIGYSAVKLFCPNMVACFPSYARRVDANFQYALNAPKESILYRDCTTGQMWLVGEIAQNTMQRGDTSDSEASLYGRDRYESEMFKVISRTGFGIAMQSNEFGSPEGRKVIVQTGLPERYMGDSELLKDALCGKHEFDLKIGTSDWVHYSIDIAFDDIYVMSQPKGTLFSVCIDKNGRFHKDAAKYLSSSVIVFDPGFGTLDLFPINSGVVGHGETYSDLGMKRVLQETSKLLAECEHRIELPVPAMQKYLETGVVPYMNRKGSEIQSGDFDFTDLLGKANVKVCDEAISRMMNAFNLLDYNYLIITAGTGAAWMSRIQEKFKNVKTLTLLYGNQNDTLSLIYSNVRGYYLYRFNKLHKELGA